VTAVRRLADLDATPHATVFPDAEPRTVRLALDAGERVAPHSHPGRVVVCFTVEGAVTLEFAEESVELDAGDAARFDGEREVSPVARTASTALVVLVPREGF